MSSLFILFHERFESLLINLHGIVLWWKHHWWGWCGGHEIFLEWRWFPMILFMSFKKPIVTSNNLGMA
jgi:hypothetical protein